MESKLDDSPHAIRGTFSAFYWASNFSETREKFLFLTISINFFFFFNYFHLNYGNEFFHLVLETNIQLTANILACVANYSNALWQFILCSALCYAIRILLRYCFIDAFHEVYFCWKISTKISKSWIFYFLRGRRGGRGGGWNHILVAAKDDENSTRNGSPFLKTVSKFDVKSMCWFLFQLALQRVESTSLSWQDFLHRDSKLFFAMFFFNFFNF